MENQEFIDISIKTNDRRFKYRVNGIMIHDNKILLLRSVKNLNSYCLPGGHVEFGENTINAMAREMFEETKVKVSINSLFSIAEGFFVDKNGIKNHEISFYYIVTPEDNNINYSNFSLQELDKGVKKTHDFEWIGIDALADIDLRPAPIKQKIINGDYDFQHLIIESGILVGKS